MNNVLRLASCVAVATVLATPLIVSGQAAGPAFEVASVKPSEPNPGNPLGGVPMMLPLGGRFSATNVPLRLLVRAAYAVQDFQLAGGPSWQMTQRFDIAAKPLDASATPAEMMAMLKTPLAERFHLVVHTEKREMATGALVLARGDGKLGPDLRPSSTD